LPGAFADFSSHAVEVGAQRRDALAGDGSDRKERGLGQRRAGQQVGNFSLCLPRRSGDTASILVRATAPWRMPSSSTMSRCSRVCGMGPSSAAMTSSAKSMPVAPASMLWISFSWPGTSMKPSVPPAGSGV